MSDENNKITKTRYSDEDLAEFKLALDAKLEEAKKQFEDFNLQLQEFNESGDESRSGTFDDGASNWQREHLNKLASRQQKFIRDLEYAQVRIKNKTYGVCTVTGGLISKERLKLVPHATKTVEGKDNTQGKDKKQEKPKFYNEE